MLFGTDILGVGVTVRKIDIDPDDLLPAVFSRRGPSLTIPILDLPLPTRLPEGAEWIVACRRWASD